MRHISFSPNKNYNTAICIKTPALNQNNIQEHYLNPLQELGFDTSGCVAFSLKYDKKKPSAACIQEYLEQLLPSLKQLSITQVLCCDAEYFKKMTKQRKAEPHIGHVLPCAIEGYESIQVVYGINYQQYFYNPVVSEKTQLSLKALAEYVKGDYQVLGADVLRNVSYPDTLSDIQDALTNLLEYPALTMDIEAFSLKHYDAGIGTISFSVDHHTAVAFTVDYVPCKPYEVQVWDKKDKKYKTKIAHGKQVPNPQIRALLKWFFESYTGTMIWHNISYDAYVLVYQLWMEDLLDQEGLLAGLEVMLKNFECTQLITYLATNSCAGNKLSLKEQSHEFTGNYAQDEIDDIRLIPLPVLLQYNATDTCATWFVMDKHYDTVVLDDQLPIYQELFKPAVMDIIQMQLTGMCLDMDQVLVAENQLQQVCDEATEVMQSHPVIAQFLEKFRLIKWEKDYLERKAKAKKPENIRPKEIDKIKVKFNPNSGDQIRTILYDLLEFPIIDFTDSKQAATGGKTLKKLLNHAKDEANKKLIQSFMDYATANKVLTSFIRSFKEAPLASDGCHYLFGSFKLGGTVSGRLSSSNPNMQNIPSGSTFSKIIKQCFIAPPGWVYLASDFNALEDVVNTLLTKDPNKVKVLVEGYDGHCYRMVHYWPEQFPDLKMTPSYVNALKKPWDSLRGDSKPVSFAMQYQGTWATLMKNCGFSEEEAKKIEGNYHNLYQVSIAWVDERIDQASQCGYAVGAFGLRIRTPVLEQVILGNRRTPNEASAEARTLGNAISGQSYGLLNTRASMVYMRKVRASKHRLDIRLCAHIHDAIYQYVREDFALIAWVNKHLMEAMHWQDLPELHHPQIRIGSELDIQYPTWKDAFTIPNGASAEEIIEICKAEAKKRKEK